MDYLDPFQSRYRLGSGMEIALVDDITRDLDMGSASLLVLSVAFDTIVSFWYACPNWKWHTGFGLIPDGGAGGLLFFLVAFSLWSSAG